MSNSNYVERRLADLLVLEPKAGIRQQDDGGEQATPYVTTGAVSQGESVLAQVPHELTSGNVKDRTVQRDDLLLVSRGIERHTSVPCATVKFADVAAFSESLIRLRVDHEQILPDYLRLYLTSRRGSSALRAAVTGSVISNLGRESLREVRVFVPDLESQRKVVQIATNLEQQVAEVEATRSVLLDLYDTAREGFVGGILTTKGAR